jgi:hypothetical protein
MLRSIRPTRAAEQTSSPAGAACITVMPRETGMAAPFRCSDRLADTLTSAT